MKRQSKPEKIKKEKSTAPGEWLYFAPANVTVHDQLVAMFTSQATHTFTFRAHHQCQPSGHFAPVSYTHLDVYKRQVQAILYA